MARPRILFFGYSELAYVCLEHLLQRGENVVALVTHEDDPGEKLWFRTPASLARGAGLPVFTPAKLCVREHGALFAALQPALILSVYYRQMIPCSLLDLAPLGAFNLHGSLLPKYRGRAPIHWALIHGESRVGLSLHRMVRKADAGPLVDQEGLEVGERETAEQVYRRLLPCALRLLERQLDPLLEGRATETVQDEAKASYFGVRRPEDGRMEWMRSAKQLFNFVRALTQPYPGAFCEIQGQRLRVWWTEWDSSELKAAKAAPGTLLSLAPWIVATGEGGLELIQTEWVSSQPPPKLRTGDRFSL